MSRRIPSPSRRTTAVTVDPAPPTPVEAFVAAMADDLGLANTSSDRRTYRQLHRLSAWATAEGIALDRERILDPDTVERFVASLGQERSAATYRAVLRRVGPLLTKKAPWEPRPTAIPRRQLAPPYTDDELTTLIDDALCQPSPARQRAAIGFVALGLGVGLDGRWATKVRGLDVIPTELGVVVEVGDPNPRRVVALEIIEDDLVALAALAGEECLVGGRSMSNRRTGQLIERLVTPTGHPRLSPARLRSTWLLWHLEAGTCLPELCAAAGLQGTGVLADLFPYVEPLCGHCTAAMLRDAL